MIWAKLRSGPCWPTDPSRTQPPRKNGYRSWSDRPAETTRLWRTVCRWWKEIEVLIVTGATTAKVEANNTAIKHIKMTGREFTNAGNDKNAYPVARCRQNSGMNIHLGRAFTTNSPNRGVADFASVMGASQSPEPSEGADDGWGEALVSRGFDAVDPARGTGARGAGRLICGNRILNCIHFSLRKIWIKQTHFMH